MADPRNMREAVELFLSSAELDLPTERIGGRHRCGVFGRRGNVERRTARAFFADRRIGDRLVLELARLDAFELLELVGEDRDGGPRLHRRANRLVQAAP